MAKRSAGILPYRRSAGQVEVLLVHPGGPFWAKRDLGAWSIAKGEHEEGEDALQAAIREFFEETGHAPTGPFRALGRKRQPSGKMVEAWAAEMDWDPAGLSSNTFVLEWPPGSGKTAEFPEVDRAGWFATGEALRRILPGQRAFIDELVRQLGAAEGAPRPER